MCGGLRFKGAPDLGEQSVWQPLAERVVTRHQVIQHVRWVHPACEACVHKLFNIVLDGLDFGVGIQNQGGCPEFLAKQVAHQQSAFIHLSRAGVYRLTIPVAALGSANFPDESLGPVGNCVGLGRPH